MGPARAGSMFILVFGAGLLTGLSHFWGLCCVLALTVLLSTSKGHLRFAGVAVLLGVATGRTARWSAAQACAARLPSGSIELTLRLHDEGEGHGQASATPLAAGCRGRVTMLLPAGKTLPAGRVVRVRGRWLSRSGPLGLVGGILVAHDLHGLGDHPTPSERIRRQLARSSRMLYGARAPLVDALVLGARGSLDPEIKRSFASSGLVHLLSISGFHVGLIVAWIVLAVRALGFDRRRALWCGASVGVAYAGFLGWPAPATRAAVLCLLGAAQLQRQRHASLGPLLALTCLLVALGDPWAVVSVGAWLSVAALAGAAWAAAWCERVLSARTLPRLVATSTGATLATAPITAGIFGTVPLIGIVLNLAAIPLAALAVPGVVASLLVHPVLPGLAGALAAGAGLGLHALELLARAGAALPHGCLLVPPTLASAVGAGVVLMAVRWAAGPFVTLPEAARRVAATLALASWIAALAVLPAPAGDGRDGLTLHFLDVGQGDGAAIRTPHGHWVLVDAGPRSPTSDAGRRVVLPFLARHRVHRLDVMIISHAHADHIGGAPAVLDQVRTGVVVEPGELVADPVYTDFLAAVAEDGARWRPARSGLHFEIDSVRFTVLHPDTAWAAWGLDLNEDSAVLLVEYRAFRALLAGDAGFPAETRMAGSVGRVDLLKVGHHGSRWASGDRWLDELHPELAVVSVGHNRYGHPSQQALARLAQHGIAVWRTDQDGSIAVTTDGYHVSVAGRRRRAEYQPPAQEMEP